MLEHAVADGGQLGGDRVGNGQGLLHRSRVGSNVCPTRWSDVTRRRTRRFRGRRGESLSGGLDEAPVLASREQRFCGRLPEDGGDGALVALREPGRGQRGGDALIRPRFFHFVTGGTTPAALAADWLTSLLDQNAFSAVSSHSAHSEDGGALAARPVRPLGVTERRAHQWRHDGELLGLACGRRWWRRRRRRRAGPCGPSSRPRFPPLPARQRKEYAADEGS